MSAALRLLLVLALFSGAARGNSFALECSHSEVSCDDLFADIVTEKFTRYFDHRQWAIFVLAENFAYGNGSGVATVIVGAVEKNSTKYSYFPRKRWSRAIYRPLMGSAYEQREALRQAIRRTIEAMMVACEDSPSCDIAPRK